MKTSELKPKVLTILFSLYEKDPAPEAYGEISSLLRKVYGASPEEVGNVIKHLNHIGLTDAISINGKGLITINDAGIRWLDEHNELLKQKSLKHWLVKPAMVAVVVCIITTPIVIAIQGGITTQSEPSSQLLQYIQQCTQSNKEKQKSYNQ